ncbi:[FeFe] hydrogenase H-cluster maturation GTPase HydF [Ruminiclostridium sufflavum DSM 19573]|uniref:[FeFe] hydrogenase H-cluster maturation GTPase HydF n=1 Tax=Ruminiclostridium sufflavum DSM 19573 TaxID=1121337 RepID=A0A318XT42_9FIRM|nr:[FeFe] hydrogenase H-cluster maturation GTPase HydF [Ruminiclostridium sufflavum]PYG89862.1 [FeFe] hydrogenase H-cluster maturation GTPase HydF [Ruminiclostridium sufflavum DSM 19573]
MSLNETPRANRLHIGIFGKRNSGKSSLINAVTGHDTALVSEFAGTTTDPVYKSMEIYPIGPCVLIDTAGFDDEGAIGQLRVEKTREAAAKTDIALIVIGGDTVIDIEKEWLEEFRKRNIPAIAVLNKSDLLTDTDAVCKYIENSTGLKPVVASSSNKTGIDRIRTAILRHLPEDYDVKTITGNIVKDGDVVLLVMPQDIQAPKGRLILPQVQTLRELLDRKCLVLSATTDKLDAALKSLSSPPDVIITDSQVFKTVYDKKPEKSKLTSFSVLFAGYKGDIEYFTESAAAIDNLTEDSRVLIAEACTHAPLAEDIGREKLPNLLRKKVGQGLAIDIVSGNDFPDDLTGYALVIQCGACMFNRKYVISRIERAREQEIPMSNYGVVIAYLSGILDKISLK